ncbi:hepatic lectin, partial [Austrofundulus limnaeus]|uniref:Hepatic lectin n=1 Tax=Austrofundulus limnaeus TaxID=52670 RepID=A0A2I4CHP6_AUSLI
MPTMHSHSRPQEEDEDIHQQEAEEAAVRGEAAEKPKRNSKLPLGTVVLLVLCVLLAAALIIITLSTMSVQTKKENEALRKNLSDLLVRNQNLAEKIEALKNFSGLTNLQCGAGWEEHGGKRYKFLTSKASWQDSRSFCRDLGGDLVKIDSREEQEFLVRRLRDKMISIEDWFWIGLTDSETEGSWLWVDRSPLDKSFWMNGEPNNAG